MSLIRRSRRATSSRTIFFSFSRKLGIVDAIESVDRRSQRSERILELVRDVGGEGFDIVDPVAQRLAHVGHRAREQSDFVAARRQPRDVDFARSPEADAVGRDAPAAASGRTMVRARNSDSSTDIPTSNAIAADDDRALVPDGAGEGPVIVGRKQHFVVRAERRRK